MGCGDVIMAVRFLKLPAARVFNLTSPRWLPQLALAWYGKRGWHNKRYEPVRDICEHTYIDAFNKHNGHYEKLAASIQRDGIRNPVMLTTGPLLRRKMQELPPDVCKDRNRVVCEYVGGSRLYVAASLGIDVPAIVNDQADLFPDAEEIPQGDTDALLEKFKDHPRKILWRFNNTVYANFLPYTHFAAKDRALAEHEQSEFRRNVIKDILEKTQTWMARHDV